jgi:methyl-accepting chemotaxis protein
VQARLHFERRAVQQNAALVEQSAAAAAALQTQAVSLAGAVGPFKLD